MKRNERVTKIMTANPLTVHGKQNILEVQKLMAEHRFHHVPVVSGDKLVGMISATDLSRATYEFLSDEARQTMLDPTRTIDDVMQTGLVTISESDTIRQATEKLAQDWFHALPVVDDENTLKGIVTTTDVLNYLLEQY